jgi:reactive intermediate/imine deaminase
MHVTPDLLLGTVRIQATSSAVVGATGQPQSSSAKSDLVIELPRIRGALAKSGEHHVTQRAAVAIVAVVVTFVARAATDDARYIVADHSPARASLPYSEAVWGGNVLYVAGHLGLDPTSQKAPQDPALETKLVLDAVKATVERAGLSMDDFVSVTVYCSDLSLYDAFNAVYKGYFHTNYPARAFIGVAQLVRGAHFEVQGIAVRAHEPKAK